SPYLFPFFLIVLRPPRSTLFPSRRSSDLLKAFLDYAQIPFRFLQFEFQCRYIVFLFLDTFPVTRHELTERGREFPRATRLDFLRSEEHTSELQSRFDLVCRLLLEKKKNNA